jgi:hypothetical protein
MPQARDQRADYQWKKKYAGLGAVEARQLNQVQDEPPIEAAGRGPDGRQADAAGGPSKKSLRPSTRKETAEWLVEHFAVGSRRACALLLLNRSTFNYRSRKHDQLPLIQRLRELAEARRRYGYRRLTVLLQREGWAVEPQAGLQAVSEGGARSEDEEAEEASGAPSRGPGAADRAESAVVHGLRV